MMKLNTVAILALAISAQLSFADQAANQKYFMRECLEQSSNNGTMAAVQLGMQYMAMGQDMQPQQAPTDTQVKILINGAKKVAALTDSTLDRADKLIQTMPEGATSTLFQAQLISLRSDQVTTNAILKIVKDNAAFSAQEIYAKMNDAIQATQGSVGDLSAKLSKDIEAKYPTEGFSEDEKKAASDVIVLFNTQTCNDSFQAIAHDRAAMADLARQAQDGQN